jgi:hypothetical protein
METVAARRPSTFRRRAVSAVVAVCMAVGSGTFITATPASAYSVGGTLSCGLNLAEVSDVSGFAGDWAIVQWVFWNPDTARWEHAGYSTWQQVTVFPTTIWGIRSDVPTWFAAYIWDWRSGQGFAGGNHRWITTGAGGYYCRTAF